MGASLAAASLPSGRPINGDPGGKGCAAAGGVAGGADAGGCWAKAGGARRAATVVPASRIERRTVIHGIIEHLPMVEPMSHVVQERTAAELAPTGFCPAAASIRT